MSGIPSNNAEGDLTSVSCTPATAGLQTCVAVDNIGAFNDIVPGTVAEVNGVSVPLQAVYGLPSGYGQATGIGCFGRNF